MSYDVNSRNKMTLVGNIGQDLDVKDLPNGRKVVNASVCTNEAYTPEGGERVETPVWHRIVAWGPFADRLVNSGIKAGSRVLIEGRMTYSAQEKTVDGVVHHYHNAAIEIDYSMNLSAKSAA